MIVALLALAWLLIAVVAALVVSRGMRIADQHAPVTDHLAGLPAELTVDDILGRHSTQHTAG